MSGPAYDAVVLAGGAARRLGGRDKARERVGGATLLDRVLVAVSDAGCTVVVGPARPTVRPVVWTRETPPGGGPVAALAAGLTQVRAPTVVLLAADLPFVTPALVRRLVAAVGDGGSLLLDPTGRDQLLVSAWRTASLRGALAELASPVGASLRRMTANLVVRRLSSPTAAGVPPAWLDCDTEDDLRHARELA